MIFIDPFHAKAQRGRKGAEARSRFHAERQRCRDAERNVVSRKGAGEIISFNNRILTILYFIGTALRPCFSATLRERTLSGPLRLSVHFAPLREADLP